jgi:uncharacterized sulfatase
MASPTSASTESEPEVSRDDARDGVQQELDRRRFLKSMGAVAIGGILADLGVFDHVAAAASLRSRSRPNIVVVMVDELRFPSVFPTGIKSPEQFLQKFMPNLFELWRHGVKFTNHQTAGMACSPARAALMTGLYPHQQWLMSTRTGRSPMLQTQFPTYGKLLRKLGYHTPYVGKWHLSNAPSDGSTRGYLEAYGFSGMTNPDPLGTNGEGQARDPGIADQAIAWLQNNSGAEQPYCLTVSFVNPHDRQFFWGGSEGTHFESLFAEQSVKPFVTAYSSVSGQDDPPPLGYPAVPPNWESADDLRRHNKPDTQQVMRAFQQLVWGAATDNPQTTGFSLEPSPIQPENYGLGVAPFSYWQRGMDMYTYVMTLVDEQIGRVVAGVPRSQLRNTVFVFMSDHGEFNGAHGILAGKIGAPYEEAYRVPLIVADASGRFASRIDVPRNQLTSSVDLMPLLVTLGNGGSRSWMKGQLAEIYGGRLDLIRLLRNARAAGRDHLLFASDEVLPAAMNYLDAPTHLLGVRTRDAKLCTYSHWAPGTATPVQKTIKLEFYDYATKSGRAETLSSPDDPRAMALARKLFRQYVPQEMEAPLPAGGFRHASRRGKRAYLAYQALANAQSIAQLVGQEKALTNVFDWGLNM